MLLTSEKTSKKEGWTAQGGPEQGSETQAYRDLIGEAVETLYAVNKALYTRMGYTGVAQPVSLMEIYRAVQNKIDALKRLESLQHKKGQLWPHSYHGKRWLDRRINEAACPKYYQDAIPRIVAATAGFYEPNSMYTKKQ